MPYGERNSGTERGGGFSKVAQQIGSKTGTQPHAQFSLAVFPEVILSEVGQAYVPSFFVSLPQRARGMVLLDGSSIRDQEWILSS